MIEQRVVNLISVSGGKDSTATMLYAIEQETKNTRAVFADTGHEHPTTYEYLDYLRQNVMHIETVRADFSRQIAKKREFIVKHWANHGIPTFRIERALEVLQPTGVPFLDLCLWKGRFPSTRRRFCTTELKHLPIKQLVEPLLMDGIDVVSWQGVRADESRDRANLPKRELVEEGLEVYRPLLNWTAAEVFEFHRKHKIKWNPLYEEGMGRVGCMPCINTNKRELKEISNRFPSEIERIKEWESLVSQASKRGVSTFYDARVTQIGEREINLKNNGISIAVQWANTTRGGRKFSLFDEHVEPCSSIYNLCELPKEKSESIGVSE